MAMPLETAMPCSVKLITPSINLLRSLIAALRGTRRLAYQLGMSRCSVPCTLHSSCSLRFLEVSSWNYSPSPKQSLMSSNNARIASASSSPFVSMVMVVPLEAASIITPMMLLAFTRRLLRDSITSHLKLDASCVNLAEARACRPSLLMISTSCCCMLVFGVDVSDASAAAFDGDFRQLRQRRGGITSDAQQHRQGRPPRPT